MRGPRSLEPGELSLIVAALQRMGLPSYRAYLASPGWKRRRGLFAKRHERVCAWCGSDRDLALHHHDYRHLGRERDRDLMWLCREHHQLAHVDFLVRRFIATVGITMPTLSERGRGPRKGGLHTRGFARPAYRAPPEITVHQVDPAKLKSARGKDLRRVIDEEIDPW